jgi:hypothetical protein
LQYFSLGERFQVSGVRYKQVSGVRFQVQGTAGKLGGLEAIKLEGMKVSQLYRFSVSRLLFTQLQ